MSKLVVLELDGDFEQDGFRVTLEIGLDSLDNYYSSGLKFSRYLTDEVVAELLEPHLQQAIKIKGYLPANPELAASLQSHWQENYRSLGAPTRIKSKKIIHKGSINQRIKQCRESADQLQSHLNKWLKSEWFREIDSRLREELNLNEPIRFLLRTNDLHLQKLPWHLWDFFERYPLAEVAFSPLESQTVKIWKKNRSNSRIRVLVILGHQDGIDIEADYQLLKKLPPVDSNYKDLKTYFQQNQRLITVCEVGVSDRNPGIRPPAEVPEPRLSFSDFPVDADGVIRRQLLGMAKNPTSFCSTDTSFSFRVAQLYLASKGIEYKRNSQGDLQIGDVVFEKLKHDSGGYHQVDALGYQILVNYRATHLVAQQITLTEILSKENDAELSNLIKGRIILIGTTAESFKDYFPTPYSAGQWSEKMPGVLIHANMLSQILSAVLDKRPLLWWWPNWGENLWIASWSLVGGLLVWYVRPVHLTLANVVAIGILSGLCFVLLLNGGWVPLVPSALALVITSNGAAFYAGFQAKRL